MAYSQVSYSGDGATKTFSVPFPYISQTHVTVTVNGTAVPFTWPTTATVTLASAPALGAPVLIQRTTPISNPSVVFNDGGTLTASDLNTSITQDLYAAQESQDRYGAASNQFYPEKLTVTSGTTLSALTYPFNGTFFLLTVNGQSFQPQSGAVIVSGTSVTINPAITGFSFSANDTVIASYTHSG